MFKRFDESALSPRPSLPPRFPAREREELSCERLELRVLMDGTPFPALADLEDGANPVVRIETTLGTIDIEMYPNPAQNTFARFLDDLRAGKYDQTVFHRSISGQLLQMGALRYGDAAGPGGMLAESEMTSVYDLPHTLPVPDPEVVYPLDPSLPELQWTVSLSEVFYNVNVVGSISQTFSSTSLTFNLTDSPVEAFDTIDPGVIFTERRVIGRVLAGGSRDVVSAIAALPTVDSSGYDLAATDFGFILGSFPTLSVTTIASTEAPPALLAVETIDIEVIKAVGTNGFLSHKLYYPEGWASELIDERILISNPTVGPLDYQVIIRYENGWRDRVFPLNKFEIASGELVELRTSVLGEQPSNVRANQPYSIEIHATGALAATLYHRDDFFRYDSGREEGLLTPALGAEAFFTRDGYDDNELMTWDLPHVTQGAVQIGTVSYVLWQNLSERDLNLTITVYSSFEPTTITTTLGAHRRGGMQSLALSPGGVRIVADGPIVVSTTMYGNDGGPYDQTFMALGVPGGGSTAGVAPGRLASFNQNYFNIMNAGSADAAVIVFVRPDGDSQVKSKTLNVPAGRTRNVSFIQEFINELYPGEYKGEYSLWYESNAAVTVSYWSEGVGTTYAARAASIIDFADGSLGDGDAQAGGYFSGDIATTEEIAIFNPYAWQDLTFSLTYTFLDGTSITTPVMSVGSRRRVVAETAGFADVLTKIRADAALSVPRYSYAIRVNASGPVVAQLTGTGPKTGLGLRFGEIGHLGNPSGTILMLNDPILD